ncbi:MAG: hypothetical protein ACUZ8O_04605 [Candidatus Anammoxibacter sp.]
MSVTILKHIKGSELPLSWRNKLKFDPDQAFTVIVEPEQEYKDEKMPKEDMISDELIKAVKRSEDDMKAGCYTECKTKEESDTFFKKILNE